VQRLLLTKPPLEEVSLITTLDKIPTCLTVCVLVMIFACLKRHTRSARLTLWAVGWTLVSIHFLAQLLEPAGSPAIRWLQAVDAGALQFSAAVFLTSVSSVVEKRANRFVLLLVLAVPSVSYVVLDAAGATWRLPYVLCLATCFGGAALFFFKVERRFSMFFGGVTAVSCLAGGWGLRAVLNGSFHEGAIILLGLGFALPGVFLYRNDRAPSPAVLTITGGFLSWGASFPMLLLGSRIAPHLTLPGGFWDTPKLFVAFGMILAVVEEKSSALLGMQRQAELLNRQLERFAGITSRLLNSTAPDTICQDIATAITEVTGFRKALIHLDSAEGTLRIAGVSGLAAESLQALEERGREGNIGQVQAICSSTRKIGKNSFLLPDLSLFGLRRQTDGEGMIGVVIPLCSGAGAFLGSITLAALCGESAIPREELARIESLAGDLAVAVELRSLHTQLVCSEKLAAMGELVAGVAHELNNPLTAIMGFGELISDALTSARPNEYVKRLMNEARRMKRMTDNLLRFSRRSSPESNAAHLSPVVQEVLALCEFKARSSKLHVEAEIAPDLPMVAANEDEIKQVLLNLFNNSCDALHGIAGSKQFRIRAYRSGANAVVEVEDTGPGFSNLSRALESFYTTKPVGKGTGLGLSVCYGIAKRRGGDLRIENLKPSGARVTLEVPLVETYPQSIIAAGAPA